MLAGAVSNLFVAATVRRRVPEPAEFSARTAPAAEGRMWEEAIVMRKELLAHNFHAKIINTSTFCPCYTKFPLVA